MPTPLTTAQRDREFGQHCVVERTRVLTPWGDHAWVHDLLVPRFTEACARASRESWDPRRIDSYACRNIRGSTNQSLHAWALAWDFFRTDEGVPPPGGVWKPDATFGEDFARHFVHLGFRWGRWFTREDWPHIEWPWGKPGPFVSTITPEEAVVALNKPACKIIPTPDDGGYLIVAQDGGTFAYGNAMNHGSLGGAVLNAPVVDAEAAGGDVRSGYYLLGADGGVFTFGAAKFHGSPA